MSKLEVITLPVASLRPYSRNARTHSDKQSAQIAVSIRTFGFNNPILVDKDGVIIAGHGRVAAAKSLGLETVPVIRFEHMSEAERRAYILADNKLAEKAGWDSEILAIELQNLLDSDLDFDLSITGFEMPEIDVLISGLDNKPAKPDPADAVPDVIGPAITRLGDIWQIGTHRLICGDALQRETYTRPRIQTPHSRLPRAARDQESCSSPLVSWREFQQPVSVPTHSFGTQMNTQNPRRSFDFVLAFQSKFH